MAAYSLTLGVKKLIKVINNYLIQFKKNLQMFSQFRHIPFFSI